MKSSANARIFGKANLLGGRETGLHKSTQNEIESLQAHVEMAMKHNQLVSIHTPLSDKAHGKKSSRGFAGWM